MSSSFQLSASHPIAHTSALALSILATLPSLYALQSPATFAAGFGLSDEGHSPLWSIFAGRNIAFGLLLTIFSIQGKLREVGICLMCGVITAAIDGWVTAMYGDTTKIWGHSIPAAVFGPFGTWLVFGMH